MRIVTSSNFCDVCVEGLWRALLERIELIDDIQTGCHLNMFGIVRRFIRASLIPLAQFRLEPNEKNEAYIVVWSKDGEELTEFSNKTTIEVDNVTGNYTVEVRFITDEVRVDVEGYLTSTVDVEISNECIVGA